jgi:hypothetical protein
MCFLEPLFEGDMWTGIQSYRSVVTGPQRAVYGYHPSNEITGEMYVGNTHDDTVFEDIHDELLAEPGQHRICKITANWDVNNVCGLSVFYKTNGVMKACKSIGSETKKGNSKGTLTIAKGDFITHISGRHGAVMDFIHMETKNGKSVDWGGEGGDEFEVGIPEGDYVTSLGVGHNGHIHNFTAYLATMPRVAEFKPSKEFVQDQTPFANRSDPFGKIHDDT